MRVINKTDGAASSKVVQSNRIEDRTHQIADKVSLYR